MGITIHAGTMGDSNQVFIQWNDENGVRQEIELEVSIWNQDKPRIMELAYISPKGKITLMARGEGDA